MAKYEGVIINIEEGDRIRSKKGILTQSPITKKYYLCYDMEYLGGGHWIINKKGEEIRDVVPSPTNQTLGEKVN